MGSTLGGVASGGLKIFATGVTAAATGIAALGTAAVNSYADFEQLAGGIETLFGARGAESVEEYAELVGKSVEDVQKEYELLMEAQTLAMKNADAAYKTAGLSANDYMETVTSLAASLKQSTETEVEAAEAADQAIIDMSDNANKMGTSMESIQNAYQGFAKQNYTMLDNLKLGYGGTKEEMQRLIDDANRVKEANGEMADLSIESFADVTQAIHIIQTEMGITGATAQEAETTISGSLNAMNASWANLITGIANENANLEVLVDQFVDSAITTLENILPVAETAINGSVQLVYQLLTTIGPDMMELAYGIVTSFLLGITERSGDVFSSGSESLLAFIAGISNKIPELLMMATDAIISMAMAITEPNTLLNIINAGIEILLGLVDGILHAIPDLLAAAPILIAQLVTAIVASCPSLFAAATEILIQLAGFLVDSAIHLQDAIPKLFLAMYEEFTSMDWASIGLNMLKGIWDGIQAGWDWLNKCVEDLANSLFDSACDTLDIHSPSRKFKWIGEMCVEGVEEPMEDFNPFETFQNSMEANIGGLKATYASAKAGMTGGSPVNYNQTVNVNQPVSTPDELARVVRTESKYGLIIGEVVFG